MSTAAPVRARPRILEGRSFRGDIQGLRSVAVIGVVLYHLDLPFIPGGFVGVDVFFVISGYLITGILLKQLRNDGRVSLVEFYSRRAKRLLPAATLVLCSTAALTVTFLPVTRWGSVGWDLVAASAYVLNWRLAADSVDYLTKDAAPSPLQHFWSLGVEEQFYLLWPLLLIVAGWLLTRGLTRSTQNKGITDKRLPALLLVALALVLVPSLIWSIFYTTAAPGPAYFVSTTRFWQLAVGAVLAVLAGQMKHIPALVAGIMGWAGLAGIFIAFVIIDRSVPYPGGAAALPTIATALVIAAGVNQLRLGPELLLGMKPMLFLGKISYSIYLWHWPLIVVAGAVLGHLDLPVKAALIMTSIGLAYLTFRYIERPFNEMNVFVLNPFRGLQLGCALTLIGCLVGGSIVQTVRLDQARAEADAYNMAAKDRPVGDVGQKQVVELTGALTLPDNPRSVAVENVDVAEHINPAPIAAAKDFPSCLSSKVDEADVQSCEYGDKKSKIHVALVGDSHAKQWISALDGIARANKWLLTAYIHDACPFALGVLEREGAPYESCNSWNERMQDQLATDDKLRMVITSNYTNSAGISGATDTVAAMSDAFRAAWTKLTMRGLAVAVIRDTPAPGFNVPDCVAANLTNLSKCTVKRGQAVDDRGLAQLQAAKGLKGVTMVDLNDYVCPGEPCAPVVGNVLVYRDSDHLTATYARTLSKRLEDALPPL